MSAEPAEKPPRKLSPQQKWAKKNRKERWAHRATEIARKQGLIEQKPCEHCGEPNSEAHHTDYDRPLQVTWLCRACHKKEHVRLKAEAADA